MNVQDRNYKELYEKALLKNKKLKKQIDSLQETVRKQEEELFSCDTEVLKGELFGKTLRLVRIDKKLYVQAELWTTDNGYNGHINGTAQPLKYTVFLRCSNSRQPIPYWCATMDLNFVITRNNHPRIILNPAPGQPVHLLIDGDVWAWESFNEENISPPQLEHDIHYLTKCALSALRFLPVVSDKSEK